MSQIKVLVIDDEADMNVVAMMLRTLGYNVTFLHNDEKAPLKEQDVITALQGVDVLLTDGFMPGLDGSDVIRIALDQGLSLDRICVMTGFLKEDLRERIFALGLGVTQILQKPFTKEDLRQFMKKACDTVPAM